MVNTKHDTTSYENCGYQREIFDGNALYEAYKRARKGSDWKPQVQKFEMNYLLELANMQKALKDKSYEFLPTTSFMLHEQRSNMDTLFNQLKEVTKCSTQSPSPMVAS